MTMNAKTKRLSTLAAAALVLGSLASAPALAGDAIGSLLERLEAGQGHMNLATTTVPAFKSQKAMSESLGVTDGTEASGRSRGRKARGADRFERFAAGSWENARGR